MNERIQQLAEQCYHQYSSHNIDLTKFSELLVKECVEQIPKDMDFYDRNRTIARIMHHFGVDL